MFYKYLLSIIVPFFLIYEISFESFALPVVP